MLDALKVAVYKRLPGVLRVSAVRHVTPNFTVGSLALLTNDGTRLLLVRPTYRNGWVPPGGLLGRGETSLEGVARELREELGLSADLLPHHRVDLDVGRQTVTFLHVGVVGPEVPVADHPEIAEVRWWPVDALPPAPRDYTEGITPEDLAAVRAAVEGRAATR